MDGYGSCSYHNVNTADKEQKRALEIWIEMEWGDKTMVSANDENVPQGYDDNYVMWWYMEDNIWAEKRVVTEKEYESVWSVEHRQLVGFHEPVEAEAGSSEGSNTTRSVVRVLSIRRMSIRGRRVRNPPKYAKRKKKRSRFGGPPRMGAIVEMARIENPTFAKWYSVSCDAERVLSTEFDGCVMCDNNVVAEIVVASNSVDGHGCHSRCDDWWIRQ